MHILATQAQHQSSGLINLPSEILVEVFKHLEGASRVCLALTSRETAGYGRFVDLRISFPSMELRQSPDWLLFMQQLKTWMPANLRYCGSCHCYILKEQGPLQAAVETISNTQPEAENEGTEIYAEQKAADPEAKKDGANVLIIEVLWSTVNVTLFPMTSTSAKTVVDW
jgi:F-box domain